MCDKTKRKIDRATILYKIFLIFMIFTQAYPIIFVLISWQGIMVHTTLTIYLIFRYYMLVRMRKRAIKLDLSLTEFLQERENCITDDEC
jgi:hypothetical protein